MIVSNLAKWHRRAFGGLSRAAKPAAVLSVVLAFLPGIAGACAANQVTLKGEWGQARFTVEVADDAAERGQGLMNRASMPRSSGMLFVYEQPQSVSFWMKNTLIPLDMIFLDRRGRVTQVHENAVPEDLTPIFGGDAVQFVLEINGGLAGRLGIGPGTNLQHPVIGPDAAFPCAE